MTKIKDNLGYSQEELKKFYYEGKIVLLKYKSMFCLKFSKDVGFYFVFYEKTYGRVPFTKRGTHHFIDFDYWKTIRDGIMFRRVP